MNEITISSSGLVHPRCDCHQCTYLRASSFDKQMIAMDQCFVRQTQETTKQKTSNE